MNIESILKHICVHDPQSPYFDDLHHYDEQDELPKPRNGCFCDNCFYGRDALAIELLNYARAEMFSDKSQNTEWLRKQFLATSAKLEIAENYIDRLRADK